LVKPESASIPAVEAASAQPVSVTTTVCPLTTAVGAQLAPVKPEIEVTVVEEGTVTPLAKTIVTVEVPVRAPVDEEVNPTS